MLPYGRTWNCRITRRRERRRRGEKGGVRARDRDGAKLEEERRTEQENEYNRARYVVCAWRGWRLPHEALRAELSYPHIRTYIAERGAGPDLITLPYT